MSDITATLNDLKSANSIDDLRGKYALACSDHQDDAAAMWAIVEVAFAEKTRLESIARDKAAKKGKARR